MEKITQEQGQELLIAINKMACAFTLIYEGTSFDQQKKGITLLEESQDSFINIGVPMTKGL